MKTYVACVGEEAVLAFRAENDDEAHELIDDEEGSIRSDLKVLVGTGEKSLWDGTCQSAFKFDPGSASNFDPFERRVLTVALASSELAGVAETWRARVA
jgi:hypothetical protein